ncbi:MAG: FKBP-type peptidyl-prolyl cis-trans isomerase [Prevotella sp.]|nr:FKBP-type peptidyl-prolyl cis-trans isomerase [Prevotella sp.]
MKKALTIALALLVAGASFSTATAGKKKKKKEVAQPVVEAPAPVSLVSSSDTLSYAAGMMMTNGLVQFLQQQFKVDTAYMADFVRGFNETVLGSDAPAEVALRAGRQIGQQLKSDMVRRMKQDFTDTPDSIVETLVFRGFTDALMADTTVMNTETADNTFKTKQQHNNEVRIERLAKPGRDFLAANKQKEGVIVLPSGLQYKVLVQGTGEVPQTSSKVKVNYEGRLIDGTVFDASSKHGNEPATFQANQVIRGWTEALTMMPVGSKWQLYIPQELAYGDRQAGNIPPYSTLIFDVELLSIEK